MPLASYIYVIEDTGLFRHMWLPALMVSLASCLSVSLGTRKISGGIAIAITYAAGLLIAADFQGWVHRDAIGLSLADTARAHAGRVGAAARRGRRPARPRGR